MKDTIVYMPDGKATVALYFLSLMNLFFFNLHYILK